MLRNLGILLLFLIFATGACVKNQVETNAAGNSNSDSASSAAGNAATTNSAEKTKANLIADNPNAKIFRGMINGTSFEMHLLREGDKLSGTYFYIKVGKDLNLSGTIDAGGKFSMKETDPSGKATGEWNGTWKEEPYESGAALEGSWKKPGQSDGDSLNFYATQQMIELTNGAKLVNKTVKENNKEKRSEISSVYPELTGVNSPGAQGFNALVKNSVVKMNDAFRKDVAEMTAEDVKNLPGGVGLSNDVSYDVLLVTNDLISISIMDYTFMGGAHGGTSSNPINYDLKNNRELKLADIFEPGSNYLKIISDYAIADLKPRVGDMSDDEWLSKGAAPEVDNYRSWNLTRKGLMVTFDQYQVAAYAAGPQQVIVPYSKLQSVLRKDGVVAELAK